MEANERKVIDILSDKKHFVVPFYQREYKWEERLWRTFWDGVIAKAQEVIDGDAHAIDLEQYH